MLQASTDHVVTQCECTVRSVKWSSSSETELPVLQLQCPGVRGERRRRLRARVVVTAEASGVVPQLDATAAPHDKVLAHLGKGLFALFAHVANVPGQCRSRL